MDGVTFNDKTYTEADLKALSIEELLTLRNLVADNLSVARIKSFKDHDQAVTATTKALEKYNATDVSGEGDGNTKPAKKPKAPKEPKEPAAPAKCGFVQTVKRPTRGMFRTILKIKEHPGKGDRIRRWPNYLDGMTLLTIAEGDDMDPLDIGYYVEKGLMSVTDCTDEQYDAGLDAWYKKHGLKNPAEQKAALAKEREEAKAKKTAERDEAKAKKAEEKTAKDEARKQAAAQKKTDQEAKAKEKAEAAEKAKAAKAEAKAKADSK